MIKGKPIKTNPFWGAAWKRHPRESSFIPFCLVEGHARALPIERGTPKVSENKENSCDRLTYVETYSCGSVSNSRFGPRIGFFLFPYSEDHIQAGARISAEYSAVQPRASIHLNDNIWPPKQKTHVTRKTTQSVFVLTHTQFVKRGFVVSFL